MPQKPTQPYYLHSPMKARVRKPRSAGPREKIISRTFYRKILISLSLKYSTNCKSARSSYFSKAWVRKKVNPFSFLIKI